MSDTADGTSNPAGTGIAEATEAFARYLSGDDARTQEPGEAQPAEDAGTPEPEEEEAVQAAPDDEEEGQSEDEVEQEEQPATRRFTVRLDGKEVEVDEQELLAGYTRQQDYTRKTQALAEQRKAAEAEIQSIRAEREQYASMLPALAQMLKQSMGAEPDWDRLYQEDPLEWVKQREVWRERRDQLQAVEAEQARLREVEQREQLQQMQAQLASQRDALLSKLPEWKDPAKASAEKREIQEYGVRVLGFTPEEMAQVFDHRAVIAMRKAMAYDKLMSKPVKPQAPPRAIEPGPAKPPNASKTTQLTRAKQRLAKTGRWQDAAEVFKGLL